MTRAKNNTHKELKKRWATIKQNLSEDSVLGIEDVYNIFFERIENRYFKPIELLRDSEDSCDGFGFSMVAILCTLIEFLQSTIDGKFHQQSYEEEFKCKYKTLVNRGFINYYGNGGRNEFVIFLKDLDSRFEEKSGYITNFDSVAEEFYSCIRCSLLHDACTRNNWIIREKSVDDSIFDNSNKEEKILYRNDFYTLIKNKVEVDMKGRFFDDQGFRRNLLKKMDIVFETANYSNNDKIPFWWK